MNKDFYEELPGMVCANGKRKTGGGFIWHFV